MSSSSQIEELLKLIDIIEHQGTELGEASVSEELVQSLEEYGSAFEKWIESAEKKDFEGQDISKLLDGHNRVLQLATRLQGGASVAKRELNKRAKGLIGYLDTLPKRVSSRKGKMG